MKLAEQQKNVFKVIHAICVIMIIFQELTVRNELSNADSLRPVQKEPKVNMREFESICEFGVPKNVGTPFHFGSAFGKPGHGPCLCFFPPFFSKNGESWNLRKLGAFSSHLISML